MDKTLSKLAVLYADICGSTHLYEKYGDTVARADLAECLELLGKSAAGLGGETIKTIGDEIMCAFVEPIKAALAATEMQAGLRRVSAEGRFKMGPLHIKIGWHFGAVHWRDDELLGEAPNAAQQIIGKANADEILTSKQSIDTLPHGMFPNCHLMDRLKADAWDGELEIYKMPWEQTGEETQISSLQLQQKPDDEKSLILRYGDIQLRIHRGNAKCIIGRAADADLRVKGDFTSRQHAEIKYSNGRISLRDTSANGTIVVDEHGTQKRLRREEEEILLGRGQIGFGAPPDQDPKAVVDFFSE